MFTPRGGGDVVLTRCLVIAFAGVAAATSALLDPRWYPLVQGDDLTISIDTATVRFAPARYDSAYADASASRRRKRYMVWSKWVWATPQVLADGSSRYVSATRHEIIDCDARRLAAVQGTWYGRSGAVVFTQDEIDPSYIPMKEVIPESLGEALLDSFCQSPFRTRHLGEELAPE